jgi:hypothetical protein
MEIEKNNPLIKNSSTQTFKFPFKFSNYINLDMGKCHVGFFNDSLNGNCAIDLMGWKMSG